MRRLFLSILLLFWAVSLFAQYPHVSIYDIQTVPPGENDSPLLDDTVYVCGIVTVGTGIFYGGSGATFYMQDSNGGPFSGIMAYYPDSDSISSLVPGDSVCFLGVVWESGPYDPPFGGSMTEILILPGSFELISQDHPLPEVMIITADDIDSSQADSLAEQYEACRVRIYYATVDSVIPYTNTATWICHDTSFHQFQVREASDLIDWLPWPEFRFEYIQGVIFQRFESYKIQPAYWSDLVISGPGSSTLWHWPPNPVEGDTVNFYVNIPDEFELERATLYYRLELGSYTSLEMTPIDDTLYACFIPPMDAGTRVDYYGELENTDGIIIIIPDEAPWNFYSFFVEEEVGIVDDELSLPDRVTLYQNYPNPFNASTTISFTLPEASFVTLRIYDLLGREKATLAEKHLPSGTHSIKLNCYDLPSGIYFYQLRTVGFIETKSMNLVK